MPKRITMIQDHLDSAAKRFGHLLADAYAEGPDNGIGPLTSDWSLYIQRVFIDDGARFANLSARALVRCQRYRFRSNHQSRKCTDDISVLILGEGA